MSSGSQFLASQLGDRAVRIGPDKDINKRCDELPIVLETAASVTQLPLLGALIMPTTFGEV